jgi:hypothetical protein
LWSTNVYERTVELARWHRHSSRRTGGSAVAVQLAGATRREILMTRTVATALLCAAVAPFTDIGAGLPGVWRGSLAWADYDNDGDLDIAILGEAYTEPPEGTYVASIYRNDGDGVFTDINAGLQGCSTAYLAWGDYDNDGDLDLGVSSGTTWWFGETWIYRNDGGSFVAVDAGVPQGVGGRLAWGDYDGDGDLDLAVGRMIFMNIGGTFYDIGAVLPEVNARALAWGDYNNDGDLDLAIAGDYGYRFDGERHFHLLETRVFRNHLWTFTDIGARLPGSDSLAWGDYDNDGDLDLAAAGWKDDYYWEEGGERPVQTYIAAIYRNDGGTFTDIHAGLPAVADCCVAWGDYDNDGAPDLVLAGHTIGYQYVSDVYRNDGGSFTAINVGLPGVGEVCVAWGDYDNDGAVDLVGSFYDTDWHYVTRIYRNNSGTLNTPPLAPSGLAASVAGASGVFAWDAATDAQTPSSGLSYNLRVGTRPGLGNIVPAMADPASGFRLIPALGNAQTRLSWTVKVLAGGTYYWSVQAIDTAFAGSEWAPEQTLRVPLIGDVDGDECVNVADLLLVRNQLGRSTSGPVDVNGDGICNVADLLAVRNQLGSGTGCR